MAIAVDLILAQAMPGLMNRPKRVASGVDLILAEAMLVRINLEIFSRAVWKNRILRIYRSAGGCDTKELDAHLIIAGSALAVDKVGQTTQAR